MDFALTTLSRADTSALPSGPARIASANWRAPLFIAACALLVRLLADVVVDPVASGDEAITGLMARHILLFGERPYFYYGQDYLGSFESYVTAGFFALFGFSTAVLRLTPLLFFSGYVLLNGWLGGRLAGPRAGMAAAVLAALGTPLIQYQAHMAFGGSGAELLFLGTAQLALALRLADRERRLDRRDYPLLLACGVVIGFSLWIHFLVAVYTLAAALYVAGRRWRRLIGDLPAYALGALGLPLGFAPALLWNAQNGWRSFAFLSFILGGSGSAAGGEPLLTSAKLAIIMGEGLVAALGARNDWDLWLAVPWETALPLLSGALVFFYALALGVWLASRLRQAAWRRSQPADLVALVAVLNLLAFLPLSFGPEGPIVRYLLPLSGVLPLAAVWFLEKTLARRRWLYGLGIGLLLLNNGYFAAASLTSGTLYPTRALASWLESAGLTRVYAGYWIAYPLDFASQERIIASPAHTRVDVDALIDMDRYQAYTELLENAQDPAFVFDRRLAAGRIFAQRLAGHGIAYQVDVVADRFLVFHCFSANPRGVAI